MNSYLAIGFIAMNLVAFLVCMADKQKAKRGARRVPERVLWLLTVCFGAMGMYIGMRLFHHKTQKPAFFIGVPLALVVQLFLMMWLGFFNT